MSILSVPRRRKPKVKSADPSESPSKHQRPLALRSIRDHIAVGADGTYAWFRLAPVQWAFTDPAEKRTVLDAQQLRWADLAGKRIHIRRTSQPFATWLWAEELYDATPAPPSEKAFADHLERTHWRLEQMGAHVYVTYVGVRITEKRLTDDELRKVTTVGHKYERAALKFTEELQRVHRVMRGEGFRAKPVSARSLALLVQSSVGMGNPVAPTLLAGDSRAFDSFDGFAGSTFAAADALSPTVEVRSLRGGREHVSHVAVLQMERLQDRTNSDGALDGRLPFLAEEVDFPLEVSVRFDIVEGQELAQSAETTQTMAESFTKHHQEHDRRPSRAALEAISDAERIVHEVTTAPREVAARAVGCTAHIAVTGPDRNTVLDRVEQVQSLYAKEQKAALAHTYYSQWGLYRQFTPGEPRHVDGFNHQWPLYLLATAVPNATTVLGDKHGFYLGMCGNYPVRFNQHYGPQHNTSGMAVFQADQGGGKSTLAGVLGYYNVLAGVPSLFYDPAGSMRFLTELFPDVSALVDLANAAPGTLVPHCLVPEPRRNDHATDAAFAEARREAAAERQALLLDALTGLLDSTAVLDERGVRSALEVAVAKAGGDYGLNPWVVVNEMLRGNKGEKRAGEVLAAMSSTKFVSLIFPEDRDSRLVPDRAHLPDKLLTIVTMSGIAPGDPMVPREQWTRAQRMAAPILHLAAAYGLRFMERDRKPKSIFLDEWGIIGESKSAFTAFGVRVTRNSRKWAAFCAILSQNPDDLLRMAPEISNLIGCAFIGRNKASSAPAALSLAEVPTGYGYEKAVEKSRMEPGSFLMRDYDGRVGVVDVDLRYLPDEVVERLDTTPKEQRREDAVDRSWTRELVDEVAL